MQPRFGSKMKQVVRVSLAKGPGKWLTVIL
jgi:hypothetical protein